MRGESTEEGRAEEEEERLERASLRGEALDEGKHLVEPFFDNWIRSAEAGEGSERGEEGRALRILSCIPFPSKKYMRRRRATKA